MSNRAALLGDASSTLDAAWELTRRLSPRSTVRAMVRDAYGELAGNEYPSTPPVGPRRPGTPWAMHLASADGRFRVLCFDFDGKDSAGVDPDLMERAQDDCDVLAGILDALAIVHLVCQSSTTGGRHIWVNVRDGASAELVGRLARSARASFRSLDHGMLLNAAQGCARPPLSPHRDGSASSILRGTLDELLTTPTSAAALELLTAALDERRPALRLQDTPPSGPTTATHRAHRALSAAGTAHMATTGGGSNPSWTGFMCLLSAAAAGWSLTDVEHAVRTAPGMEHYRTKNTGRGGRVRRNPGEAAARLQRQWAKAIDYTAVQRALPAERDLQDLTDLDLLVDDVEALQQLLRTQPGRWGASESAVNDRTILTALAFLTLHTGKRVVAAAVRDLALLTGLGRQTTANALQRLHEAGYAARAATAEGTSAAQWTLTVRSNTLPREFSTPPGTLWTQPFNNPRPPADLFNARAVLVDELTLQLTEGRHDLFTRAGIGHLAGRVWSELRHHTAVTTDDVARIAGVSRRHALTVLSRLRTAKLLSKHPLGWARSRRDLRDRAARDLGVAGYLHDRAMRYDVERQVWQWWQAELALMLASPRDRRRRSHATATPLFQDGGAAERSWPRYPRQNGLAHWPSARQLVADGALDPNARWKYLGDVA